LENSESLSSLIPRRSTVRTADPTWLIIATATSPFEPWQLSFAGDVRNIFQSNEGKPSTRLQDQHVNIPIPTNYKILWIIHRKGLPVGHVDREFLETVLCA